jgi:hypothetical protein
MSSGLALSGVMASENKVWGAVSHRWLDPVNPDILFGTTSSIWRPQHDTVWAVRTLPAEKTRSAGTSGPAS